MVRQQLVHSKMTVLNVEVEHDWASWVDAEFIDERNIEPTTLTELRCQHDDTSSCKIPMNIEPTTLNELRCKLDDASSCVFPMNIRCEELSEVVDAHARNGDAYDFFKAKFMFEGENRNVTVQMIKHGLPNHLSDLNEHFDREIAHLSSISPHKNVVQMYGVGQVPRKFVVLECLEESLESSIYFKDRALRDGQLSGPINIRVIQELASALHHLHTTTATTDGESCLIGGMFSSMIYSCISILLSTKLIHHYHTRFEP